jgi:hypothetical protein
VCLSVETDLESGAAADKLTAALQVLAQLHEAGVPHSSFWDCTTTVRIQRRLSRIDEEIALFGAMSGEEFFTDANSLTMVKRVRGLRSAFAAAPLADKDTANPIGGNYFPVTICTA